MTNKLQGTRDPDIQGSLNALRRAAKRALELGLKTGTPVWVIKDGRMVDLTRARKARRPRTHSRRGTRST